MLRCLVALMCVLLVVVVAVATPGPDVHEQQFASKKCAETCDEQQVECYRRSIMYCVVETGPVIDATLRQKLADDPLDPKGIMEDFAEDDDADATKRCMHIGKAVCDDAHSRCLRQDPCVPGPIRG